jgi:hypothetical protein
MTPTQRWNFRQARRQVRFLPRYHRLRHYERIRLGVFGWFSFDSPVNDLLNPVDSRAQAAVEGRK